LRKGRNEKNLLKEDNNYRLLNNIQSQYKLVNEFGFLNFFDHKIYVSKKKYMETYERNNYVIIFVITYNMNRK